MALVKKRTNISRWVVIAAAVVVVGAGAYFIVVRLFQSGSNSSGNYVAPTQHVSTNFGESIFSDPQYQGLKSYATNLNVDVNNNPGQPQPFQ